MTNQANLRSSARRVPTAAHIDRDRAQERDRTIHPVTMSIETNERFLSQVVGRICRTREKSCEPNRGLVLVSIQTLEPSIGVSGLIRAQHDPGRTRARRTVLIPLFDLANVKRVPHTTRKAAIVDPEADGA